ncbi:peptidoglycan DD-metalloendopeptidase family protein [Microscilla marina]|uniref:Putative enzyme with aminotransferase class-III domain protein n=1 Tax=Microscilla marina ATCC 23134 TaxID=313606 RepID=A1ZNI0_MICM2|nr:peptidoglycan DD-metalloendopeptidase family protein [Microscilla marina]EAY28091.1 putative enzyme with aminotransferase class-III domain protein [Microscilla marina ATCC 23134]
MTYSRKELIETLKKHQHNFASTVPVDFQKEDFLTFDFSANNPELKNADFSTVKKMDDYVWGKLKEANVRVAAGGYNEERVIYQRGEQYHSTDEVRSIHLGIDIWMPANTPVFAPLEGRVHSFKNNNNFADYGPTIILEHQLEGLTFYTLYGHLSLESLDGKYEDQKVAQGEQIATLGVAEINGSWTPHLHFQLITDMLGKKGDFIGVANKSERDYYLEVCPDPNLVLNIPF